MNNEPNVYPEQRTPPVPTYDAIIRGHAVGGWLYYAATDGNPDNGAVTIIITVDGNKVESEEFLFTNPEERSKARACAKNIWRNVVLAVLGGV